MKAYGRVEVWLHSLLTSALDREAISFTLRPLYRRENSPQSTHWTGGWVDSREGLNAVEKRKIPAPSGSRTQIVQLVASNYTDWAIPVPIIVILTPK
jgi:hypothetical protein